MSRRAWLISGAAVVAIIVVVVAIVVSVSGGDSSNDSSASSGGSVSGAAKVLALTKGIPQDGFTVGKASAPVKVQEFLDPQCPVCKKASEGAVAALVAGPVRSGTANLAVVPLKFIGSDSVTASQAIAAAAEQDRGFVYSDILYANQGAENTGWVTTPLLKDIAAAIPGINVATWETASTGDAAVNAVFAASDQATSAGVNATPTFVVTGPGGTKKLVGAIPAAELLAAVKSVS